MPPSGTEWSNGDPTDPVENDLRADEPIYQSRADSLALGFGRKSVLAEAISNKSAEEGLAAAMSNRVRLPACGYVVDAIRRPDDVQAGRKQDVTDLLPAGFLPDDETSDPEARPRNPSRWGYAEGLRPYKIRLRHP
jgi:hypothetical protein